MRMNRRRKKQNFRIFRARPFLPAKTHDAFNTCSSPSQFWPKAKNPFGAVFTSTLRPMRVRKLEGGAKGGSLCLAKSSSKKTLATTTMLIPRPATECQSAYRKSGRLPKP